MVWITHGAANANVLQAIDQHNIAGLRFLNLLLLQPLELENLVDAPLDNFPFRAKTDGDLASWFYPAPVHPTNPDFAHITTVVNGDDLHPKRAIYIVFTLWHEIGRASCRERVVLQVDAGAVEE